MSYKIEFTDTNKTAITVQDQSLNNTDTSLVFVGKNYSGSYGQIIGENFLHLLENFANTSPPENPIKGQMWYDANSTKPQLKVYDGTNWTEAGNVKKNIVRPSAEISTVGDLWVDSNNQQLYLFTGNSWVLVGPQFNETASTGYKAEEIIDRATNTGKLVISFYIEDTRILIVSKYDFVPKLTIEGFPVIRQGLNLSNADFDLDGVVSNKFWGTSEKSNSLIVGNNVVPASNFLRSDVVSTTNFALNIRNGTGLNIGPSLETSITSSSAGTVVHQTNSGATITLRTTSIPGTFNNVVTVTADNKVGINRTNPTKELDVNGNILAAGNLTVNDTTNSVSVTTGSITTAGGVGISKSLNVGENLVVQGTLRTGNTVFPNATNTYDIGTTSARYRNVYAKNVQADTFVGTFEGDLTGNISGAASRLTNLSSFGITGDVLSNTISFNGASLVEPKAILSVSRNFNVGATKTVSTIRTTTPHSFVTGYIVEIVCSTNSSFNTTAPIVVTGSDSFTYEGPYELGLVGLTAATGTITVKPGGVFTTELSSNIIANKTEYSTSFANDQLLVYRSNNLGTGIPVLGRMSRATLIAGIGTVPIGSIFPYAGDVPPPGYLLCDGSEQSRSRYPELFTVLGFKYRPEIQLDGYQTFALPDLRGRFAAGRENMDNSSIVSKETRATNVTREKVFENAIFVKFIVSNSNIINGPFQLGRTMLDTGLFVTNSAAVISNIESNTPNSGQTTITVTVSPQPDEMDEISGLTIKSIGTIDSGGGTPSPSRIPGANTIGNVGGANRVTLAVNQIPEHTHDLKDSVGNQYFVFNNSSGLIPEPNVVNGDIRFGSLDGHLLNNSGGISTTSPLGQPIDILNPYITVNYIIYSGLPAN